MTQTQSLTFASNSTRLLAVTLLLTEAKLDAVFEENKAKRNAENDAEEAKRAKKRAKKKQGKNKAKMAKNTTASAE